MRSLKRVLVVGADRALRASLTCLLQLETDLCVQECSRREAAEVAASWRPEVVLVCGSQPTPTPTGWAPREIYLAEPEPIETVLTAIRSYGT